MKNRELLYFTLSIIFNCTTLFAANIRNVTASSDHLIPIKTSLGYSTIIEFQEKAVSAILGDQDSFKLEYVGNSITLKPLFHSAKSNLFVYTGFDRFNFSLTTGSPSNTDYVVRIKRVASEKSSSHNESPYFLIPLNLKSTRAGFTLTVHELDLAKDGSDQLAASLLKFSLSFNGEIYRFNPASFGLSQSGHFLNLEGIYIDQTEASKTSPANGVIAILNQQWKRNIPLTIVFAYEHTLKKKKQTGKIIITFSSSRKLTKETPSGKMELFQIPRQ